jgi:hypothetical protein
VPGRFRRSSPADQPSPQAVVDALGLSEHVTFEELLTVVEKAHGKPIELREVDNSIIPTVTGLWLEKDTKSIILVPEGDQRLHRNHSVQHEFGHMLLNHEGCGLAPSDVMPSLFQHVGGRRGIKRMLARSLEWNETERAAEHVAYLLSLALLPNEPKSSSDFERKFG